MFVKPHYTLGVIENAVLVPQKGITSNELGNYTAIVALPLNNEGTDGGEQQYYFEKRNDVKVYSGIPGYWIVTSGINVGEQVVVSGLLNLSGQNLNDPNNKIMANIININKPETLSQEELDTIIERNLK